MSQIKFIYFDIGGVLIDGNSKTAILAIAERFNLSSKKILNLLNKYQNQIDGGFLTWKNFSKILKQQFGINLPINELIVSAYQNIPEMMNLFKKIKSKFKFGILSNIATDTFDLIKLRGLIPNIDWSIIIKSAEVGYTKPQKEIFDYALEKSGYKAEEILFIDDKVENTTIAKKLGWQVVTFKTKQAELSIKEIEKLLS